MYVSHIVDQQPQGNGFTVGFVIMFRDGSVGDRVLVSLGALQPVDEVGHDQGDVLGGEAAVVGEV